MDRVTSPYYEKFKASHQIEKTLDQIIKSNLKNESVFSPLKYMPKFYDDEYSRLKLVGNKNINLGRSGSYNRSQWNTNPLNNNNLKTTNANTIDASSKQPVERVTEPKENPGYFSPNNARASPNRFAEYGRNVLNKSPIQHEPNNDNYNYHYRSNPYSNKGSYHHNY